MKPKKTLIKQTQQESCDYPKEILSGAKRGMVFIHDKATDLHQIETMGAGVITRANVVLADKACLVVADPQGTLKEGTHYFVGVPRLRQVANIYVEKVDNGLAYISAMSSHLN